MPVGQQSTKQQIDNDLTSLALQLREVAFAMRNLNLHVNGQGNGSAFLQSIGYSAADAATALTYIGYLNNIAGVYSGTATVTPAFNFDNALAPLWAGQ